MDGIFSLWGSLLKQLTCHQGPFLTLLVEALTVQIISPSRTESTIDASREAVTFWLLEIYVSKEWSAARKRGKLSVDALLSTCLQTPNPWTSPLASAITNEPGHRRLKEIYGDRIAASVTEQATTDNSPIRRIAAGDLADLLAYQKIWLETTMGPGESVNEAQSPMLPTGGWAKWDGKWTAKPFGTI